MDPLADDSLPMWFRALHIEDTHFERSAYADPANPNKIRMKNSGLGVMRQLAPGLYEAAAQEIKEYNEMISATQNTVRKYRLGRKVGSIPLFDANLQPELLTDKKAQERYWTLHPELKVKGK